MGISWGGEFGPVPGEARVKLDLCVFVDSVRAFPVPVNYTCTRSLFARRTKGQACAHVKHAVHVKWRLLDCQQARLPNSRPIFDEYEHASSVNPHHLF